MSLKRPALRYHGGKWRLAPWIITHFPRHRVYVEPYGGGGSVLLRKPRSYAEIYNDLDGEVVNLFRVLRDPERSKELAKNLELTPFSHQEFDLAYRPSRNRVEQARRTIIKSFMGFGSAAVTATTPTKPGAGFKASTGFRANANRSGTTPAHDWANFPPLIASFCERLQGVVIENRDALEVMAQQDSEVTLHYVDPPYVPTTRAQNQWRRPCSYKHEMSADQHVELLRFLNGLTGMVVLSGYNCEIYEQGLDGWLKVSKDSHADGARDRVECLWLNPRAREFGQLSLMEVA